MNVIRLLPLRRGCGGDLTGERIPAATAALDLASLDHPHKQHVGGAPDADTRDIQDSRDADAFRRADVPWHEAAFEKARQGSGDRTVSIIAQRRCRAAKEDIDPSKQAIAGSAVAFRSVGREVGLDRAQAVCPRNVQGRPRGCKGAKPKRRR